MTNPCDNCDRLCQPHGCTDWEKWFAQNWNRNIHRKVTIGLTGRQVFRYEHPDRIREMVAEMGPKAVAEIMTASGITARDMLLRGLGPEKEEDGDDADWT